jgi:uncharacterized membrane protein
MPRLESRWLVWLAGLCLLTTLWLRFFDLERMLVWHDEVYSIARVFGIPHKELVRRVFDAQLHSPRELLQLQQAQTGHGLAETWRALKEHPEHGPLYYLAGWSVTHWVEDPRTALRGISVALGLLLFPALFWLSLELFERRTAWLAVSLAAASPLWLLYAREARQYAFWLALVVAASAALLRALRKHNIPAWGLYAALLTLACYTHLLSAQVILAHALFLLLLYRRQRDAWLRIGGHAGVAWALTGIACIPWGLVILERADAMRRYTGWMNDATTLARLVDGWMSHLNRLYVDLPGIEFWWPFGAVLLLLVLFWFLPRAPRQARLMLGAIMLLSVAVTLLPDLLLDGRRSLQVRYLLPLLLALQLVTAWVFARGTFSASLVLRSVAIGGLLLLLGAGFASGWRIVNADTWWTKSFSAENARFAELINSSEHPLLVGSYHDVGTGELLSLAYRLRPKVRIWMERSEVPLDIPEDFTGLYALNPSKRIREAFADRYRFERFDGSWKWYVGVPVDGGSDARPVRLD